VDNDFKVGDVVVCVDAEFAGGSDVNRDHVSLINKGCIYKVSHVLDGGVGLSHVTYPYHPNVYGYKADRFRHLPKADDTFIQQMRSLKPARIREP